MIFTILRVALTYSSIVNMTTDARKRVLHRFLMKYTIPVFACLAIAGCKKPAETSEPDPMGELDASRYRHVVVIPDIHGDAPALLHSIWLAYKRIEGDRAVPVETFRHWMETALAATGSGSVPPSKPGLDVDHSRTDPIPPLRPGTHSVALVQLGDLVDRGTESVKCLRIIEKIKGVLGWDTRGLFGNHELLNMARDSHRFVHYSDLGAYPPAMPFFEDKEARMEAAVPGGPIHSQVKDSLLGMVRLTASPSGGDVDVSHDPNTLFVHGGVDMKWLNAVIGLKKDDEGGARLVGRVNAYFRQSAQTLAGARKFESGDRSPVWTNAMGPPHPLAEDAEAVFCTKTLEPLLARFGVARIVIGHMPQYDYRFKSRCGGKVLLTDVTISAWMSDDAKCHPSALIMTMAPGGGGALESIIPYTLNAAGQPEQVGFHPMAAQVLRPYPQSR